MPCLPESLPLEMHRLLCSWVRSFTGLDKCWFTLVIQWLHTGFVCICCFKQLMKQSSGGMKMFDEVLIAMKLMGILCYTSCSQDFPSCS